MVGKKGVFFSLDALIALTIILFLILIAIPLLIPNNQDTEIHRDTLKVLSTLQMTDVQSIIDPTVYSNSDPNSSVLKQIAVFSLTDISYAESLARSTLSQLKPKENIGLWFGDGVNDVLVWSRNATPIESAKKIDVARETISGIGNQGGGSVTGHSAIAFLAEVAADEIVYFGGYVGDGNITVTANLKKLQNGQSVKIEGVFRASNNITLRINNGPPIILPNSSNELSPIEVLITNTNFPGSMNSLIEGINKFYFTGENLHIAGGFMKITYEKNGAISVFDKVYYFPGINGLINLYDGLYIPGNLEKLNISLHLNSPDVEAFLTIGNVTVWNGTSNGQSVIFINDSQLKNHFNNNYSQLSQKTLPLRLGLVEISQSSEIDVVLITDRSASMLQRLDQDNQNDAQFRLCNDPLILDPTTRRISLAKCLDIDFVSTILSASPNSRVALVSFGENAQTDIGLTNNLSNLNSTVDSYLANLGTTCIGCAVNEAYKILNNVSDPTRQKFVVLMTDGAANRRGIAGCYLSDKLDIESDGNIDYVTGSIGVITHMDSQNPSSHNSWDEFYVGGVFEHFQTISVVNSTLAMAVSTNTNGGIYKWNGVSWSNLIYFGEIINGIDLLNNNFGFAVGLLGKIYKWNGISWAFDTSIQNNPNLQSVSVWDSTDNALAVGNGVLLDWDGGTNWISISVPGINFNDVKYLDKEMAFAVGDYGKIYQWDGISWTQFQDTDGSGAGNQIWYSISVVNPTLVYIAGSEGKIYVWTGGSEFTNIISPTSSNITGISFNGDGSGRIITGKNVNVSLNGQVFFNTSSVWSLVRDIKYTGMGSISTAQCVADDINCNYPYNSNYAAQNAHFSSCRIKENLDANVYTIGFGPVVSCALSQTTLNNMAVCGGGEYFASQDASELQEIYAEIAQIILSYSDQTVSSSNIHTVLYNDSSINFEYEDIPQPYGLIITAENKFDDENSGTFTIPSENTEVVKTVVTSYSGPKWTDTVTLNNGEEKIVEYNLSTYGSQYVKLGDPFHVNIPSDHLIVGNTHEVDLKTGSSPNLPSAGSVYNKIIYTVARTIIRFSPIVPKSEGCEWKIQFENDIITYVNISSNYNGENNCIYDENSKNPLTGLYGEISNMQDATQLATLELLRALDFDTDGKVDVNFPDQGLQISPIESSDIPFTWSTTAQMRVWR